MPIRPQHRCFTRSTGRSCRPSSASSRQLGMPALLPCYQGTDAASGEKLDGRAWRAHLFVSCV